MHEPRPYEIKLAGDTDIAVGAGATIYTDSLMFGGVNDFALSYIQTATGIPNIKIEMEQSIVKPTTENIADTNFGTPKSVGNIETALISKLIQHMQLTPVTLPYIRFKITDNGAGATDTVVKMWLTLQKKSFND